MVQVVKFTDQCHPGEDRTGELKIGIGVEPVCDGIHLLPPGPERLPIRLCTPAQRPVEGVAVRIGEAWQHHAVEPLVAGLAVDAGIDRAEAPVSHLEADPGSEPTRQLDMLRPVPAHPASPASARRTSARASTPARQSSRSANSAGEWEIPLGLRTKIIATGIPALARIPAS